MLNGWQFEADGLADGRVGQGRESKVEGVLIGDWDAFFFVRRTGCVTYGYHPQLEQESCLLFYNLMVL